MFTLLIFINGKMASEESESLSPPTIKSCLKKSKYIGKPSPWAGLTAEVSYYLNQALEEIRNTILDCLQPSDPLSDRFFTRVNSIESKLRRSSSPTTTTDAKSIGRRLTENTGSRRRTITWAASSNSNDSDVFYFPQDSLSSAESGIEMKEDERDPTQGSTFASPTSSRDDSIASTPSSEQLLYPQNQQPSFSSSTSISQVLSTDSEMEQSICRNNSTTTDPTQLHPEGQGIKPIAENESNEASTVVCSNRTVQQKDNRKIVVYHGLKNNETKRMNGTSHTQNGRRRKPKAISEGVEVSKMHDSAMVLPSLNTRGILPSGDYQKITTFRGTGILVRKKNRWWS